MIRVAWTSLLVGAFLFWPAVGSSRTWNIAPDGSGDCPSITAGVDSAAAGDTLMLAPGTYAGADNRDIDFAGKDLVLTSLGGAALTIIDCEAGGRAFSFTSGESPLSVISGLTITDAQWGTGGAIYIENASPTILNNVLTANNGTRGAAIYVKHGSPTIDNNLFDGNIAAQYGGAMFFDESGQAAVTNNTIRNNTASFGGGGIYCSIHSPDIIGNLIHGNTTITGGGIYLVVSDPLIEGNTIVENTATDGAGIAAVASSPIVSQCIIAFNTGGAGISCPSSGNPTLDCCVIFGNGGGDAICGTDAGDNLFVDPEFCGVIGSEDFTLQSDSPCALGNNACGVQVGVLGVACSVTDAQPTTWGRLKARYRSGE